MNVEMIAITSATTFRHLLDFLSRQLMIRSSSCKYFSRCQPNARNLTRTLVNQDQDIKSKYPLHWKKGGRCQENSCPRKHTGIMLCRGTKLLMSSPTTAQTRYKFREERHTAGSIVKNPWKVSFHKWNHEQQIGVHGTSSVIYWIPILKNCTCEFKLVEPETRKETSFGTKPTYTDHSFLPSLYADQVQSITSMILVMPTNGDVNSHPISILCCTEKGNKLTYTCRIFSFKFDRIFIFEFLIEYKLWEQKMREAV